MISRQLRTIPIPVIVAMLLVLSFLASACDTDLNFETETRSDSFSVGQAIRIVVDGDNGSINVVAGSVGTVEVNAELRRPKDLEYSVVQDGDVIQIKAKSSRNISVGPGPGANIMITTPANATLALGTSNGKIEIDGMLGSNEMSTSNGKIIMTNVNGEFDAETSNGSIDFTGEFAPGSDNRFRTSNGSVTVNIEGVPSVELDASTSNGDVESDHPILVTNTDDKHLVGTIGDGDANLYIKTSNGSINVK